MSCGYYKICSKCAYIKVLPEELKEFYVSGDAISGKLILTVSDPSCSFNKVSLFVQCSEYCDFNRESHTYERWKAQVSGPLEGCINSLNSLGYGQHEFKFKARLDPEMTLYLPPTFYDDFGERHGVGWTLKAEAEYTTDGPEPKMQFINDTVPFEFHPTDIGRPQFVEMSTTLSADLPLVRFCLPHCLPQRPTKFCVRLEFNESETSQISEIHLIKMYLEKRIVTIRGSESTVKSEKTLLAEIRDDLISSRYGIGKQHIATSCQLSKREPVTFSAHLFSVQYFFHAEYWNRGSKIKCAVIVDVMPPVPEDRPE